MKMSSRRLARTWPYKRYSTYERELRQTAASWFEAKGLAVHPTRPYCLDKYENWRYNIICSDVIAYLDGQKEHSCNA